MYQIHDLHTYLYSYLFTVSQHTLKKQNKTEEILTSSYSSRPNTQAHSQISQSHQLTEQPTHAKLEKFQMNQSPAATRQQQ